MQLEDYSNNNIRGRTRNTHKKRNGRECTNHQDLHIGDPLISNVRCLLLQIDTKGRKTLMGAMSLGASETPLELGFYEILQSLGAMWLSPYIFHMAS